MSMAICHAVLASCIDLQKFYDSVDLVLLMRACGVLGYPRIPLLLLVQAFWGHAR